MRFFNEVIMYLFYIVVIMSVLLFEEKFETTLNTLKVHGVDLD